jgi:hypothetical protein
MNKLIAQVDIGAYFGSYFGHGIGIAGFVSIITSNAVAFAGIILLFLLIFGGISIMIGAGSGKKDDIAKGQKAITYAIIGFLLIFTAYWIIQLVQIIFGFNILSPNP